MHDATCAKCGDSCDATCAKCGDSCQIPFEPRQGRDVLCSDCFRTTKPRDDRYQRDDRRRQGRAPRRDRREKSRDDSFRKKKDYFEGGSDTFYANLREKLFEILGEKKCANCGFSDERALGFSDVDNKDAFDSIRRGGSASWGTYISDPDLARKKLQVLCLNCNQTK
jgi:CxxC-x17-CxxC domain-containing protein